MKAIRATAAEQAGRRPHGPRSWNRGLGREDELQYPQHEHGSERMAEERITGRMDEEKRPIDRELAELRKEVLESRNLVIKTDNLLKNLFAELKAVAKKNDDQYRRTWFASGAAYL